MIIHLFFYDIIVMEVDAMKDQKANERLQKLIDENSHATVWGFMTGLMYLLGTGAIIYVAVLISENSIENPNENYIGLYFLCGVFSIVLGKLISNGENNAKMMTELQEHIIKNSKQED